MAESVIKSFFPSQLATDQEKLDATYGLEIGRAIEREWFKNDHGDNRFSSNQSTFHNLRLYARGEQSVQKYKDELAVDGDLSYLNLDWKIAPVVPKFVDIVVNGITERQHKIKAYSVDEFGTSKRTKYMESILRDMDTREITKFASEEFGIELAENDPATLPADQMEFELHMMLDYKDTAELAEEISLTKILGDNKYDEIYERIVYDLTAIGVCAVKERFSASEGIKVEYCDPANMVWSYTEDPHFNDIYYVGEVRTVHVNELQKQFPWLTQAELKEIMQQGIQQNNYYNRSATQTNEVDSNSVQLLYFEYKTVLNEVFKKKVSSSGVENYIRKDSSFNPPKEKQGDYTKEELPYEAIMEGVYVLGKDTVLRWNVKENQLRPKSATQQAKFSYSLAAPRMYKGRIESLVGRITGFADMIQLTHLKMQQVMSRLTPDGIYIDADGLAEIDLGNGTNYNPAEAVKMYFQTGSVIGRSFTGEMDMNPGKVPVQEIQTNGGGNKLQSLIGNYNFYLQMIRDATGLNEARDGSMPDERTLVGVQKMAAANSNTATRHIRNGALAVTKQLAECLMLRLSDVLEYSPMKQEWINSIGANNVSILEELSSLHLRDFGILIELSPDEEEKALLENNIQVALAGGLIDLDDAIDVREINNTKMANQVLKLSKRKKQQRDMEMQQAQAQAQAQANAQAQQMAAQVEAQKLQIAGQQEAQLAQLKGQIDSQKLLTEKEAKKELMMLEFNLQLQLQEKQNLPTAKDKYLDDRKDNRERMKKPGFESAGNDTMQGEIGLGSFEPR
jgi:hypothetical protein